MTATRVPAPTRARYDIGRPPWRHEGPLQVRLVGHSAVVLAAGEDLVSLTASSVGLMPGGLTYAADADFARVRAWAMASGVVGGGLLGGWAANAVAWSSVSLQVNRVLVPVDATTALGRALAKAPPGEEMTQAAVVARSGAREVARAAAHGLPGLEGLVRRMVGAGPGSTPAGDDVLVGVQAGLHALGKHDVAHRVARASLPALARTTPTGAHFLRAAADNRFAEHVHAALGTLSAGRQGVDRLVKHARTWGATSGIDLLWGLAAALASPAGLPEAP